ncbi:GNAT family N-acetyltransferase [Colwellia sp. 4_MG-2023]|uniref:GNAT family N-acetyltransferase n=1 Tax=unclassified Colwellia TaxID=196834 RepID=UPI001C08D405|nr:MULTISPECIES: GNAT family N-acetyltransferase [unclassified Colwellia]MBU2925700.1 GNAT family N-acetyltransferase [Colwellia sp. C2M11]MDO6505653.1 GNAT family N-acetyltransferase [Colwellia sp. 5_MG-2023]MDO6554051.1 GNAT family N-acetyltransferase [Colwellia sp. 4_MG-2023]MDO6651074.1 GNAT family N-acetyltransferase [Colwellia sp. 3_MG-2023]MDO6664109.1 GNAT family N-acetyltransferase [Colwellia sp. 2_MG-2023]
MNINFKALNKHDANYTEVIKLYKEAFPGAKRIPTFLLRYKLRNGKEGFNVLYENDVWIGLIYSAEYKDIVFVQFLAISESLRSQGYGSKVMASLKDRYIGKRIILNIEELDKKAKNYEQRVKRKAFYEKNGFISTEYMVKEPDQKYEMLIREGSISKEEIESLYDDLFGSIISFFIRPKVLKIKY